LFSSINGGASHDKAKQRWLVGALIFSFSWIIAEACFAQGTPPRPAYPNCPEADLSTNWRDYFLAGPNQRFSVYFDAMEGKSDAGWGTLSKGLCLRGYYQYNSVWVVYGRKRNGEANHGSYSNADPRQNQISIWGHVFTFDSDTGEIYDQSQGLVGHLHCVQLCK
jgi:hypothetical protein